MKLILFGIIVIIIILGWKHFILDYDKCYSEMENDGNACFGHCGGICGGTRNTEYLSEMCIHCPYYVSVDHQKGKRKK